MKPRKSKVSGLPTPRWRRFFTANRPKLHEAGLVLVEAETEPGQPLPNVAEIPLRIPLVLEPDNDIVGVTDDDRFAIRGVRAPFLVEPQVEYVVQEHVRQDGGNDALNAKGNFRFERQIVKWRDRPLVDLRRKR